MNIIEINNLTFRYGKKFIYDGFNLNIEKGSFVTIAGPNGSGKTTLVKLLSGLVKNYSDIKIFGKPLNKKNINDIRKEMGIVFDVPDNYFACETVEDELAFSLENMSVQPSTIKKKINEISKLLKLDSMLKENPMELSGGEKQKLALACALMLEPRILILDEALMMIDINEKKQLLKLIKEYNQKKRVTIVCLTHDLEEALYSDRIVVLNEGKIIIDGKIPYVFEEEVVMRKIGLEVPFIIELIKKLKVYEIVDSDNNFSDFERLVDYIWK